MHYDLYQDKQDILKCLQLELRHRISWLGCQARESKVIKWLSIMKLSLEWVEQTLSESDDNRKQIMYNQFVRNDLTVLVKNELQGSGNSGTLNDVDIDKLAVRMGEKVQPIVEMIMNKVDDRLVAQQQTGSIALTNIHLKERLIGLFQALKELQKESKSKSGAKNNKGEL